MPRAGLHGSAIAPPGSPSSCAGSRSGSRKHRGLVGPACRHEMVECAECQNQPSMRQEGRAPTSHGTWVQIQWASPAMSGRNFHGLTPLSPASPAAGHAVSSKSAVSQAFGGPFSSKVLHFQACGGAAECRGTLSI